jgi:nitroreductase
MDFSDLLKKRRSVRDFEDRPVPKDLVEKLINESLQAPSASNMQPWRFTIVHNREAIRRISDESKSSLLSYLDKNPNSPVKNYAAVLSAARNSTSSTTRPAWCSYPAFGKQPCTGWTARLCAAYLMMAAASEGLGTCWVDLGAYIDSPDLRAELGLADDIRVVAPIILGYPKSIPEAPPRQPAQILAVLE